jgi:hypothetical protein
MLDVGQEGLLTGNVTTLIWIAARSPADVAARLGYRADRLDQGYKIALLKDLLHPQEFEFEGTTLRSGGRLGLPGGTAQGDALRTRVHQDMIDQYGLAQYRAMQQRALASVKLTGPDRIAKVLPATAHDPGMRPDIQYPMGGGGLQWKILPPGKRFVIAARIDAAGTATTPDFSVFIGKDAPYENRAKLMRYLESA